MAQEFIPTRGEHTSQERGITQDKILTDTFTKRQAWQFFLLREMQVEMAEGIVPLRLNHRQKIQFLLDQLKPLWEAQIFHMLLFTVPRDPPTTTGKFTFCECT